MLRHASDFYPKTRKLNREPLGVSPNAELMIHWGKRDKIKAAYEQSAISSSFATKPGKQKRHRKRKRKLDQPDISGFTHLEHTH